MTPTRITMAIALLAAAAAPLASQTVGTVPDKSPFVDLRDGQRLGIDAGYMFTSRDAAGVGPHSGPTVGLRYDLYTGGPVYVTGRLFGLFTERDVLDYTKRAAFRNIGTEPTNVVGFDAGVSVALTGDRSWYGWQPLVHLNVGLVGGTDQRDVSGYTMGTSFAFSYGLGWRWVTGKNSELRADFSWYYWTIKYPGTFRSTQGDPVAIRPTGTLAVDDQQVALGGVHARHFPVATRDGHRLADPTRDIHCRPPLSATGVGRCEERDAARRFFHDAVPQPHVRVRRERERTGRCRDGDARRLARLR